jgi:hypothetical protein
VDFKNQGMRRARASTGAGLARGSSPLPDAYYYLSNFERALASLDARYADLWHAAEREFLAQFAGLPKASRALLVRMVMRKGVLFRASRLNYPEIGEPTAAAAPLSDLCWVDDNPSLDLDQLQGLLGKNELLHYFELPRRYEKLNKPELVDELRSQYPELKPFHAWCAESSDRVYELRVARLCERFRLMFFGNFHQDWTEFVLTDLGITSYEKIPASLQSRPFGSRAHIDAFQQLQLCQQGLEAGMALDQVIAAIPPAIAGGGWLEERRQKLLFEVARAWERHGDSTTALAIFSECTHRGARLRTIRLCERAHEWEIARDLCLAAQQSPESEAERQQLCRLLPRLNRKLGVSCSPLRRASRLSAFEMAMSRPDDAQAVEHCVRDCLAQQAQGNTSVYYVENGLANSLFGLLCWNAIFAPIPGAFFHDFQYGPADLASDDFYQRRQEEFADSFAELESEQYQRTIRKHFAAKAGIQSPFVAWRLLSRPLLESALMCIPAAHLRIWFEWIVRDLRDNRAGFPDLVQFWPLERRYRMIEVKGPGDRLQDNQRRLLEYCASRHLPVSVCHVRWVT